VVAALGLLMATAGMVGAARVATAAGPSSNPSAGVTYHHVCGSVPGGYARCHSIRVDRPHQGTTCIGGIANCPTGYGPADLQSAYKLASASAASGAGQTVAIVDAFDDPTAEQDLATYRSFYGLSPCTSASGCFKKVSETGSTTVLPPANPDWDLEISLDVDMVSAVCPKCNVLLVEATSNLTSDLYTAEDEARVLGANEISNSWGGSEASTETADDAHFNHPGIAITASSGDSGFGVSYPAASRYVTAVGGTSLSRNALSTRGWSETAWSGAGSGCSQFEAKPSWQTDTGCGDRTVSDVSADADPNTGVAILYANTWFEVGGTSVASPVIAAVYALAGNAASVVSGSYPYSHTTSLFDVTSGSNGTCSPAYLCTAGPGYDGPTGLGTPNGTGAF
jgi:subtilase family serine protease